MILTARGAEQQAQGVNNTLAYINVALALGFAGRPGSGYGTITGQGNGQGGREHGQKADQLPGYRRDRRHRRRATHVARSLGDRRPGTSPVPAARPTRCSTRLGDAAAFGRCSSWARTSRSRRPHGTRSTERLTALDFLVVSDFFLSETARLADVVLPSAQWAEEDGTMTNLEGRVILRRRARSSRPPGVRTDLEILARPRRARSAGSKGFRSRTQREVFDRAARARPRAARPTTPASPTSASTAEDGVFWPCPSDDHPGTPRLFAERFPRRPAAHDSTPCPTGRRRTRRTTSTRCSSRPAGCSRTTSRAPRRVA